MKYRWCQILSDEGRQCRRRAVEFIDYHGDNQLYNFFNGKPGWVKVYVCNKHLGAFE